MYCKVIVSIPLLFVSELLKALWNVWCPCRSHTPTWRTRTHRSQRNDFPTRWARECSKNPSVSVPVHPKGVGWLEAGDSRGEELDSIPQSGTTVPLRRVPSCWKQEGDEHKPLTHKPKTSSKPQMNPHKKCKTVKKRIKKKTPSAFHPASEMFGCLPSCQRMWSRFFFWNVWVSSSLSETETSPSLITGVEMAWTIF